MVREVRVFISPAGSPEFGKNYRVVVLPPGAMVSAGSASTTIAVHRGHGFSANQKLIVNTDTSRYRIVQSVDSESIEVDEAVSVAKDDLLVNLGTDSGVELPNYDGSGLQIYADPAYEDAFTDQTVQTNSFGRARYWHRNIVRWELVVSGSEPVAVYTDTGSRTEQYGMRRADDHYTSGTGTEDDPYLGWAGAVAENTRTIFSPNAFYGLASELTIPAGATLEGGGPSSVIIFTADNVAITNATDAGDITLRDLKVDAQGDTFFATPRNTFEFVQGQGQNYIFENLHVTDATKAGIRMEGESGVKTNCVVRGCTVTDCDRHGIEFSTGTTHSQIVGNYVEGNNVTTLGAQIYCSDTDVDHCTVTGNVVIDGNDNGIRVLGNFCAVSNNVILNGANDGIRLNGTYHTCTGNTINNVAESGIKWDGLTDSCITGNTVESAGIHGIHGRVQTTSGRNNISGNTIRHSAIDGIRITNISAAESDTLIANNNIQNNGTSGIDLGGAVRAAVTGNLLRANSVPITDGGTSNICWNNINGSVGLYGTDIDSAATITVPPDGDRFEVNGTTTITDMTPSWPGREITLVFTGILTFTNGNHIKLDGAANFVTTASDIIKMHSDGTNWREISRSVT